MDILYIYVVAGIIVFLINGFCYLCYSAIKKEPLKTIFFMFWSIIIMLSIMCFIFAPMTLMLLVYGVLYLYGKY